MDKERGHSHKAYHNSKIVIIAALVGASIFCTNWNKIGTQKIAAFHLLYHRFHEKFGRKSHAPNSVQFFKWKKVKMSSKCCVPHCDNGYESTRKKKRFQEKKNPTLFKVPTVSAVWLSIWRVNETSNFLSEVEGWQKKWHNVENGASNE